MWIIVRPETEFRVPHEHLGYYDLIPLAGIAGIVKWLFLIFLFVIFFQGSVFSLPAWGSPAWQEVSAKRAFQAVKGSYLSLKKNDPQVEKLFEWEKLASKILSFLKKYPEDRNSAVGLYLLGCLNEEIYRKRYFESSLQRALYFYETFTREYPTEAALTDEALIRLGDLRRDALHDNAGAKKAYRQVIDNFASTMGQVAKKKIQRIEEEEKNSATLQNPNSLRQDVVLQNVSANSRVALRSTDPFKDDVLAKGPLRPLIVIDPGHGGEDLGAVGPDGVLEKEVVLRIAFYLNEFLRERLRARTLLTRDREMTVSLPERTRIANENQADLFISIHANASETKTLTGIETYYLDNTNDQSSLKLAERENESLRFGGGDGGDLQFILSDFIQHAKLDNSISLAHYIQNALATTLSQHYGGVKNLGVKKAPFYVLVGAHMPCILAEVSFMDHPVEGKRLSDPRYQQVVAQALYRGVQNFFEHQ